MGERQTITCIIDWFTPAFKAGGPIRSLSNLADAIKDDMTIRIVCSNRDHDGSLLEVPTEEWITRADGVHIFYTRRRFRGIQQAISGCLSGPLFINGIYSLHFNLLPLLLLRGRKIISVRGMLHPGGLSQKRFKKRVYLALWNWMGLSKRCEFHATTDEEFRYIRNIFGDVKIWVVPNMPHSIPYIAPPAKEPAHLRLCSISLIGPMKNHLLVLQALKDCTANIAYDIYGPVKDPVYWRRCLQLISELPSNIKVCYHGEIVPEKVAEVLAYSHVFVQPSLAENFSHSIFEALIAGRPVVTSHFTPWNELQPAAAGINVDIGTAGELASAISYFASMDAVTFDHWSTSANRYAKRRTDVQNLKNKYQEMFATA